MQVTTASPSPHLHRCSLADCPGSWCPGGVWKVLSRKRLHSLSRRGNKTTTTTKGKSVAPPLCCCGSPWAYIKLRRSSKLPARKAFSNYPINPSYRKDQMFEIASNQWEWETQPTTGRKQAQQPEQINGFKILLKVPASAQIMKMNHLFLSDFSFLLYINPTSWSGL